MNTVMAPIVRITSGGTLAGVGWLNFCTNFFSNYGMIDLRPSGGPYIVGTLSVYNAAQTAAFFQGSPGTLKLGLPSTSTNTALGVSGTRPCRHPRRGRAEQLHAQHGSQFSVIVANTVTVSANSTCRRWGPSRWTRSHHDHQRHQYYQLRVVFGF